MESWLASGRGAFLCGVLPPVVQGEYGRYKGVEGSDEEQRFRLIGDTR